MKKYFAVALTTALVTTLAGTAGASEPKGEIAVEGFGWTPSRAQFVVGEVVDTKFTIANHGEVVEQPSIWFGSWADKMLAQSDNFIRFGSGYALKDPLPPGESVEITVRAELVRPGFSAINVRVGVSLAGEANTVNNNYAGPIIVSES
ncbi:MAG: hypothetical protein QOF58_8966 [Pseudonocardiales bacterium]|nr:hypothetical protein [Pseudonocardiales bacterium]